ncbi:uncharacterized protein [Argopecten irradians]|uniref:uncharacterized protein isoform X2 n=1 Tax=Argopecten irradians TaxID=31199 RepID=UPI003711F92B
MASRYPSQTETTNFARLSRLVLDVCSDILRDVLDTHIPQPGLHAILNSQKHNLRQKLVSRQLSILYPPGNVFPGTLEDLDFSLLYSLVRNIQGINISPHIKGWGREPDAADRSLAANIDRLRVQRNEAHGHLKRASLSDTDFRRIWGIIRQCISEIEQGTLTGHTYVREVDNLLNVTMDPDTEKELIQRLQEQQVEFETIVEGLKESMARDMKEMKEIPPELKPMIETTINRIKTEKEKKFLKTKAFYDAEEKLRMNRVLVIQGNTGDGKTSTAFQLLHSLTEEQQSRKPLQLHKIKKLDLLAPNSNLVCIIDDIFGQKDISKSDEGEWNKRLKHVETLFVDKQNQTNILLITIRNEIFNALTEQSLGTVFTEENIVDLSSDTYKIKEEKQELLAMYTPKNVSWTEKEMTKILGCELHIGFPQCCHLFSKSDELQKKGAEFFENPFQFFKDALSKLPECSAILFLFLNDGEIKVNDLDPNGDKVDKTLLEQAFRIKLVNSEDRTKREYEEKVDFVRESLDKLLGFLVRKEKHWLSGEEVYRFDHDSIYVTVALLYGNKTPVGYIKHCPRKALSYLTTVKTSTDMVVISPGHYNDLCERLLREFESVKRYMYWYDTVIGSLDVWKEFVEIFDKYLNEKKVNKLNILNKACLSGSAELALYLLKNGVKPDEDTDWWRLIAGGRWSGERDLDILKEIVVYLNDEMKQELLNKACEYESSEWGMYLLSVGAKPDEDTMFFHIL